MGRRLMFLYISNTAPTASPHIKTGFKLRLRVNPGEPFASATGDAAPTARSGNRCAASAQRCPPRGPGRGIGSRRSRCWELGSLRHPSPALSPTGPQLPHRGVPLRRQSSLQHPSPALSPTGPRLPHRGVPLRRQTAARRPLLCPSCWPAPSFSCPGSSAALGRRAVGSRERGL